MTNIIISLIVGIIAGIITVIPMLLKRLPRLIILSVIVQWLLIAIVIPFINWDFGYPDYWLNGLIIGFLGMLPFAIWFYNQSKKNLLTIIFPIIISGIVLGSLIGFVAEKYINPFDPYPLGSLREVNEINLVTMNYRGFRNFKNINNTKLRDFLISKLKTLLPKTNVSAEGSYYYNRTDYLDRKNASIRFTIWLKKQKNNIIYNITFVANSYRQEIQYKYKGYYREDFLGLTTESNLVQDIKKIMSISSNNFSIDFKAINENYVKVQSLPPKSSSIKKLDLSHSIITLNSSFKEQLKSISIKAEHHDKIAQQNSEPPKKKVPSQYLSRWSKKIEKLGTKHFPVDIFANKTTVLVKVTLKADGSVAQISSSGSLAIDNAVKSIIKRAEPFDVISNKSKDSKNLYSIILTWTFQLPQK